MARVTNRDRLGTYGDEWKRTHNKVAKEIMVYGPWPAESRVHFRWLRKQDFRFAGPESGYVNLGKIPKMSWWHWTVWLSFALTCAVTRNKWMRLIADARMTADLLPPRIWYERWSRHGSGKWFCLMCECRFGGKNNEGLLEHGEFHIHEFGLEEATNELYENFKASVTLPGA